MDFNLTEEQEMIRTQVRELADSFDMDYWRNCDRNHEYPHEYLKTFADAGWLGIAIPEAYGGAGLNIFEACLLLEEICASGAGTTGASPVHFAIFPPMPIIKYGTEEQKKRFLPKVASGEIKVGFGVTEPDAGTDTTRISTYAEKVGDDYIITGQKIWSTNIKYAQRTLLLARTTPYEQVDKKTLGMSLFMLDLESDGIERSEIEKLGRHAIDSNILTLDHVRVPKEDLIGEEGQGFYHLLAGLNSERLLIAAEAVGIGRAAIEMGVKYANERIVFNRPIGMNQGIQFPLADAHSKLVAAQLLVYKGATMFDQGQSCGAEATMAKLRAAEAGFEACDVALQVHGGMGYASEYHIERLWREIRLYKLAPISQEMALNYIGQHVLGLPKSY